ncbi:MAG: hypothetical protein L0H84_08330 [Pseudonocardia sp.]|nr:hypothetical protein [Pseudonocardia sp.]
MKIFETAEATLVLEYAGASTPPAPGEDSGLPSEVAAFLAHLRLLSAVSFQYLVADDDLLPPESIRFFYLDRNWTDAAVDGALAAGTFTTAERAALTARYEQIRAAVDTAERNVWAQRTGGDGHDGPAEVATGFLLRSRAVSGWPGLHVRGYRGGSETPMRMLRIERLAPAVLFALVDGIPDRMVIEEPRQGIQFGVDAAGGGRFEANVRDPGTGAATGATVGVPFRSGSPGVIDMTALRRRLVATGEVGTSLDAAEYALQMLQLPYQQWFGEVPGHGVLDFLKTGIAVGEIRQWLRF